MRDASIGLAPVHAANGQAMPAELTQRLSLCEALDRILNKGAVVAADAIISVAGIDLLQLQLRLLLSAVETIRVEQDATDTAGRPA